MNCQPLFKSTYGHWRGERAFDATHLPRHLENDLQRESTRQSAGTLRPFLNEDTS